MFQRWQTEKVQHLLSCRRGVNLTGARESKRHVRYPSEELVVG